MLLKVETYIILFRQAMKRTVLQIEVFEKIYDFLVEHPESLILIPFIWFGIMLFYKEYVGRITPWIANVAYGVHNYWSWEVGWEPYATAYYNATNPAELAAAKALMDTHLTNHFDVWRNANNVPVINSETSTGKLENGTYYPNRFVQFHDQLELYANHNIGSMYFSCDRDRSHGYHGLLEWDTPPTDWSEAGDNFVDAVNLYYPPMPTLTYTGSSGFTDTKRLLTLLG